MNRYLTGCATGTFLLMLLTGCGPELAQSPLGAEEEQWQSYIQSSYSSWRPPRVAPPATFDNRNIQPEVKSSVQTPPPAEQDNDSVGIPEDGSAAVQTPASAETSAPAEEKTAPAGNTDAQASVRTADDAVPAEKTVYEVQKGDTLSHIAQKMYGNGNRFMPILKANESVLHGNPDKIRPGMKLDIPKL